MSRKRKHLLHSGPLAEDGPGGPENRYGRYGSASFFSRIVNRPNQPVSTHSVVMMTRGRGLALSMEM